jgi:hypothetical protein
MRLLTRLSSPARSLVWIVSLGLLVALGGCDGCESRKPYTPYTLGTAASSTALGSTDADLAASTSAAPKTEAPFVVVTGAAAPGDGKAWSLATGRVAAPPERVFTTGLVLDVDGDEKPDLLAWARSPEGRRGELWFARGSAPASAEIVAALPPELSGEGCTSSVRLQQIGAHVVALDVAPACAEPPLPSPPDGVPRWLAVVDFSQHDRTRSVPEVRLELRVKSPPPGETLSARLETRDEDQDGRDDVLAWLSLGLSDGEAHSATALLRFFDRPAGLARDPSEPEASLSKAAQALAGRARRAKTAGDAFAEAHSLRRLHEALCGRKEAALVTSSAGSNHCGAARSIEAALSAQGFAALTLEDWAGAVEAAALLDAEKGEAWRRRDLDKAIAKAIPAADATLVHPIEARPAGERSLRFDVDNTLIVRTLDGAVRVYGASYEESDPREEDPLAAPSTWPPAPSALPTPRSPPMPSATSPDKKTTVTETPRGLLVVTVGTKLPRLLTGSDAMRAKQCAPADRGERLACVIDGVAVLLK